MKNSTAFLNFPFIILSFILTSCGGSGTSGSNKNDVKISEQEKYILNPDATNILAGWSKENIVINHMPNDADNLHPTNGQSAARGWIMQFTQNYILRTDAINLDIIPDLAVALPEVSPDQLRFTYTLRNDATWDDGSPITVDDIIFTYKANICPLTDNPETKNYFENLLTIDKDPSDDKKFTMVMKKKYIQSITFVTDYPIMQRSFFDKNNVLANYSFAQLKDAAFMKNIPADVNTWAAEFNSGKYYNDINYLVGAGPYKITSWERGQTLVMEKKQNHWTSKIKNPTPYEAAYPEKIIFKINTDENSQMLEFKQQTIDVSEYLATRTVLELAKDSDFVRNYNYKFTDNYNYNYIGMNLKPDGIKHKKIFTDVNVRRAFAYATPADDIINTFVYGKATRWVSMSCPVKPGYNTDLQLIPYDLAKANALLDSAGWIDTDGDNIRDKIVDGEKIQLSFDFMCMTGSKITLDITQFVADSYYKIGAKANVKPVEFSLFYDAAKKHDFDMMWGSWAGSSVPEDYSQVWGSASWANGGDNFVGYSNPQSDKLIDSLNITLEDSLRIPMIKRLQKLIYDDQPYIFMYAPTRKNVIHKRFGNQYMTFERPGVVLNYLKLLSLYGTNSGGSLKTTQPQ